MTEHTCVRLTEPFQTDTEAILWYMWHQVRWRTGMHGEADIVITLGSKVMLVMRFCSTNSR